MNPSYSVFQTPQVSQAAFARAVAFATKAHGEDGDDESVSRLLRRVDLLSDAGIVDLRVMSAAVLCDVVATTAAGQAQIMAMFGPGVSLLVATLADYKEPTTTKGHRQRLMRTASAPRGAKLVMLADVIDRMHTLQHAPPPDFTVARIRACIGECQGIVACCAGLSPYLDLQAAKIARGAEINDR